MPNLFYIKQSKIVSYDTKTRKAIIYNPVEVPLDKLDPEDIAEIIDLAFHHPDGGVKCEAEK